MKHEGLWAGINNVDWAREATGHRCPIPPADPGVIHAVHRLRYPSFDDRTRALGIRVFDPQGGPQPLCGPPVRAVLPVTFSAEEEGVCPACAEIATERSRNTAGWDAKFEETLRKERRRRSELRRIERESLEREEWEPYLYKGEGDLGDEVAPSAKCQHADPR